MLPPNTHEVLGACQALGLWGEGPALPRRPPQRKPREAETSLSTSCLAGHPLPAIPRGGGSAGFVSFQGSWAAGLLGCGLRAATEVCQQEWKNTASRHRAPTRGPLVAPGRAAPAGIPRVTGRLRGWRSGTGPRQILQNKGVLPERPPWWCEQVGCAALGLGRKRAHTDTDTHRHTLTGTH